MSTDTPGAPRPITAEEPPHQPMTAEQIKNYRNVLSSLVGPYAFLMSDADVQAHKEEFQRRLINDRK